MILVADCIYKDNKGELCIRLSDIDRPLNILEERNLENLYKEYIGEIKAIKLTFKNSRYYIEENEEEFHNYIKKIRNEFTELKKYKNNKKLKSLMWFFINI